MRIRRVVLVLVGLALSVGLTAAEPAEPRYTIGVLTLEYPEGLPAYRWLAEYLADSLATALAALEGVRVVERRGLESVMREIELSASDVADPASQISFRGLAIASHLLAGSYTVTKEAIRVNARLLDVTTGTLAGSVSAAAETDALFELEDDLAAQLARALGVQRPSRGAGEERIGLSSHKALQRAEELWRELPFHELHPRRVRMKLEFQTAIDELEEVVMESPQSARALFLLGEFQLQLAERSVAEQYFAALREVAPAEGLVGLGDAARHARDEQRALPLYLSALEADPDSGAAGYGAAKCLLDRGERWRAFELLLHVLERRPDLEVVDGLLRTLVAELGSGQGGAAPSAVLANLREGIERLGAGDFGSAARLLSGAETRFPDLYLIPYAKGAAALAQSRLEDASSALARAVLLHPLHPPVHLKLGELAMALGDCAGAVAHLRTYLNLSREGADFATVRRWIDGCLERL